MIWFLFYFYFYFQDGELTAWSNWTECSVACNGGTQERNRTCIEPQNGGLDCNGTLEETQNCNTHFCPSKN